MAKCSYCGTSIIFGGKRQGDLRFCNDKCQGAGILLSVSQQLPNDLIQPKVWEVHQGNCPRCSGRGPVDVHTSYQIWSALLLTSWKSRPHICCRSCGIKRQLGDAAFSLVLGWWGFPWGFILTPVQICRNLIGIARGVDPAKPSPELERLLRISIASQIYKQVPTVEPRRPNKALQTDDRRARVAACCKLTLAPLAAERQNRYADRKDRM